MRNQQSKIFTNEHCTGCNRCIAACTVPEANYAVMENGKNKIYVSAEKCINCGKCLEACPHDARDYLDDTEQFLAKLSSGRISIVAAPAIRSNFPGYEHLLGTLRSMGARHLYDTSFGADICTWGYIRHIQQTGATGLISQPCPAVVNFIEKHDPPLIPALAPIHSPAMCTAIYMRKYRGIDGEIAFLSPCIAKKDEFDDPNTGGHFQYNVTFRKLAAILKKRGIDYRSGPIDRFDNDQHGMGSVYPMPGGLKTNVHRVIPDVWVYQVEGQPEVRHFLDDYAHLPASEKPFLVDILNCAKGCNIGTGALNTPGEDLMVSRVMYEAQKSAEPEQKGIFKKNQQAGKTLEEFDKLLRLDDFFRSYTPKEVKPIPVTKSQLEDAFGQLYKDTADARAIDCGSCGYRRCEDMAAAVAKGLNHVGNCVEYHKSVLSAQQDEIQQLLSDQEASTHSLKANVQTIFDALSESTKKADDTVLQVTQINEEVEALKEISGRLGEMVDVLGTQIKRYVTLSSDIVSISTQTKLLSMNASVEAAHARELGKGFAVVAGEMKNLSEQSATSAKEIIESNELVIPMLEEVRAFSETLGERTENISTSTHNILESVREIDRTEQEVTEAASRMVRQKATV